MTSSRPCARGELFEHDRVATQGGTDGAAVPWIQVALLLSHGAARDAVTFGGELPIHLAKRESCRDLLAEPAITPTLEQKLLPSLSWSSS